MEVSALARDVFAAVDRMDAGGFVQFLTEDARFVYGDAAPVHGRDAVREAVAGFFTAVRSLRHRNIEVWRDGDVVLCRMDVAYERPDGRTVEVPSMTLWRLRDGAIADYQIFNDLAPLFA